MSDQEPRGPYVYQPFGMQHKEHWEAGRIYAVASADPLARIEGLTKTEAKAVCAALATRPVVRASEEVVERAASAMAESDNARQGTGSDAPFWTWEKRDEHNKEYWRIKARRALSAAGLLVGECSETTTGTQDR